MKVKRLLLAAAVCLALGAFHGRTAHAGVYGSIENSSPQTIMSGMANKAARGAANITTGWLEVPKQICVTYTEDGAVQGLFIGPLKGVGMTLVRTLAGVGELATFFVASPGFYDPYFEPAYVWQRE